MSSYFGNNVLSKTVAMLFVIYACLNINLVYSAQSVASGNSQIPNYRQTPSQGPNAELNSGPVAINFLSSKPIIDGIIDEESWKKATRVQLKYEISPGENISAEEETNAYIYEDGQNLYIAIDAKDSSPSKVRAFLSERDKLFSSDYIGVSLDTFNDSRRAYQFYVNAIGVQADLIIDEVNNREDLGWDAIWKSKGNLNDNGYQVEMSIPFKSLRFPDNSGPKQWGIKITRTVPRKVKQVYSNVPIDRGNECGLCQYQKISGFKKSKATKNLTLIPALTLAKSETRAVEPLTPWNSEDVNDRASLDVRWGLNQNLFLNATINPDFSQVEADELQLEVNNRFAIFTTEKRSFFLDGADYFSNWSRLIHTRVFIDPDYGAKITGKNGDHSYAFMSVEDKNTYFLLPDSQSSRLVQLDNLASQNEMFRYRYDLGKQGNFGMTYTQRNAQEYANKMLAFDGKYWVGSNEYFKFQALTSENQYPEEVQQMYNQDGDISGDALSLNFTHSSRNWALYATHHQFSKGFRADSGFVSKSNWKSDSLQIDRHYYPDFKNEWWQSISLNWLWNKKTTFDSKPLSNELGMGLFISADYQSEFGFTVVANEQSFVDQIIPSFVSNELIQKQYDTETYSAYFSANPSSAIKLGIDIEWGDDIDFSSANLGKVRLVNPSINYQFDNHLKISFDYINQKLSVAEETVFDVHLVNFRAGYQIDVNNFLRLTLQASKEGSERGIASQLLYSYQVNPFSLFYLGYSDEGYKTENFNSLRKTDRTLFMKFSYAWQL